MLRCLIHVSIIIPRHSCLCPYLDVGLFMSYLCDLFFTIYIFTDILLFIYMFLEYVLLILDDNMDEEYE